MIDEKIVNGNKIKSNDLGSKVQRADTAQEAPGRSQSLRGSDVLNYSYSKMPLQMKLAANKS